MADLFLSYAREDRECAEALARALKNRGWTVWWDWSIRVGRSYSAEIERELDAAACVVVLWSRHSVGSEWVQNEAGEALRREVLVPVRIDDVRPPLAFRHLQTADLFDWRNGFEGREFEACLASIEALSQRAGKSPAAAPPPAAPQPQPQPDYWIHQGGRQFPVSDLATLVQWTKEGRVQPDGQVYDTARKQYTPARDMAELRDAFLKEPSPDVFWVHRDGQQFAVPDLAALRKLAEEGGIDGDTSIYDPGQRLWVFARTMRALDGALPVKTPPPAPEPPPVSTPKPRHQNATPSRRFAIAGSIAIVVLLVIGIGSMSQRREEPVTDTAATDTSMMQLLRTGATDTADTMVTETSATQAAITETTVTQAAATDTSATQAATNIAVGITNTCKDKSIDVAIAYLDTTGKWVSHGWYTVAPGETRNDLVRATDRNVYFYGMSGTLVWEGGQNETLKHPIPVNKTAKFGGVIEQLTGAGIEKVSFFGRTVPVGQTAWTQPFNCE